MIKIIRSYRLSSLTLVKLCLSNLSGEKMAETGGKVIKMVIYHSEYPDKKLDREKKTSVMYELTMRIRDCVEAKCPTFGGTNFVDGCIFIDCCDEFSKIWLERKLPECKTPNLPVEVKKVQPCLVEIKVEANGLKKPESFLTILHKQNERLKTEPWRIIGKRISKDGYAYLLAEIDEKSKKVLIDNNREAFFGFSKATFAIADEKSEAKFRKKYSN